MCTADRILNRILIWNFYWHNNYFCHFLMFSTELLQKAGGLNKEYDGAQDYDFVLRCVDAGALVKHIPKILITGGYMKDRPQETVQIKHMHLIMGAVRSRHI